MSKLQEMTARTLARGADAEAIEFHERWYSWGEMRQVADRLRELIEAAGAGSHAPVAFAPRNQPSAIAALLGLLAMDRTFGMIYAFQSAAGIARDVGRIAPAVVVAAADDFSDELLAVMRERGIAGIALQDMDAAAVPGFERSHWTGDAAEDGEPQIRILTSGTTGPPKHFPIGYDIIANLVGNNLMYSGQGTSGQPPVLLSMPLGNISGIYSTVPPLLNGLRGTLLERFTVAGWHDHLLRYRPQASGAPPAGVQMILDADIPKEDLSCIKSFGTGAAPLDPTVQKAFEERYDIPILLSYGATEFGGPVTAMTAALHAEWGRKKFGSVGRALPGAQLRVLDPNTGEILPPGKEGILEVVSPRIGPHWIRTSDIALIDDDGFMFHRGRADGAIMRGGFKLLPETIERALLLHPAISAAAVVGVPDKRLGQVPGAAIQFKPGVEQPSIAELEAHLRQHVLSTHIPTAWRFVDDLPRTPSVKVDRPAVKRLFEEAQNG
jgi:acyl-coenzyme A synthetase/AMP-(fatty) acid ligase